MGFWALWHYQTSTSVRIIKARRTLKTTYSPYLLLKHNNVTTIFIKWPENTNMNTFFLYVNVKI